MLVALVLVGAACGLSALLRTRSRARDALGVLALVVASTWVLTEVSGPAAGAFFLAALAGMVLAAAANHRRRPRGSPSPS